MLKLGILNEGAGRYLLVEWVGFWLRVNQFIMTNKIK